MLEDVVDPLSDVLAVVVVDELSEVLPDVATLRYELPEAVVNLVLRLRVGLLRLLVNVLANVGIHTAFGSALI